MFTATDTDEGLYRISMVLCFFHVRRSIRQQPEIVVSAYPRLRHHCPLQRNRVHLSLSLYVAQSLDDMAFRVFFLLIVQDNIYHTVFFSCSDRCLSLRLLRPKTSDATSPLQ